MNTFSYGGSYAPTSEDRVLIQSKIEKLVHLWGRIDDDSSRVHVDIERTAHSTPSYHVAVQLTIPHHSLRAESTGATPAEAADEIEAKFRKQLDRLTEAKAHDHHTGHREAIA